MTTYLKKTCRIGSAIGLSAFLLSGCSSLNQALGLEESVDYRSTVAGDPLNIPPDLTQANRDVRYTAPEGVTTFSQYAAAQSERPAIGQVEVLPQQEGIQVKRDGDLRWLVVNRPAEQIYPLLLEFWTDQGFTIRTENPRTGLVETDWAENRAKIPEGWIRSALGALIDQVFDSGERERFRTRLERIDSNTSEIYISHQHMYEEPTMEDTAMRWIHGKEDPGLNATMLARLMVFLGTDVETASERVAEAEKVNLRPTVEAQPDQVALVMAESFDRAWRRVGVAIDSAGFSVEDRDRSAGDYYIRYLDVDLGEKIEQQNFFGRLFGGKNTAEPVPYRIHVQSQGSDSIVTVRDQNGVKQEDDTAKRILSVLIEHMTSN
ncbi:outer membrane protein assembly factor BamC [Achromobacter sp. F4_2707]|uniref:outer membrane protein assembly factor BamC n=1 Tax=Achromobacter sp. F4_2707 TaxID=3114286 RepID=UPI0039C5D353